MIIKNPYLENNQKTQKFMQIYFEKPKFDNLKLSMLN